MPPNSSVQLATLMPSRPTRGDTAVGSTGTVTCSRNISTPLNKGSYWGPVKLTVRVNAAAGTTLPANKVTVTAATQDVRPSNNTATISTVKVQ